MFLMNNLQSIAENCQRVFCQDFEEGKKTYISVYGANERARHDFCGMLQERLRNILIYSVEERDSNPDSYSIDLGEMIRMEKMFDGSAPVRVGSPEGLASDSTGE